jgi:hypothetical protein
MIGIAALFMAIVSLVVAVYTIGKGNRNSSVATMVTISEASREAWKRFLSAKDDRSRSYELAELLNLLEIACSILNEKSFAGASKRLLKDYLNEAVTILRDDPNASNAIEELFSSPSTFKEIQKFYKAKRNNPLSVTKPKQWFQF